MLHGRSYARPQDALVGDQELSLVAVRIGHMALLARPQVTRIEEIAHIRRRAIRGKDEVWLGQVTLPVDLVNQGVEMHREGHRRSIRWRGRLPPQAIKRRRVAQQTVLDL